MNGRPAPRAAVPASRTAIDHATGLTIQRGPRRAPRAAIRARDPATGARLPAQAPRIAQPLTVIPQRARIARIAVPIFLLSAPAGARETRQLTAVQVYRQLIPSDATGWSSGFGSLVGIDGVGSHRRLELLPFVATDATLSARRAVGVRLGADLKAPVGRSATLQARAQRHLDASTGPKPTDAASVPSGSAAAKRSRHLPGRAAWSRSGSPGGMRASGIARRHARTTRQEAIVPGRFGPMGRTP